MKIQELHIGMKVRHAHHGIGIVKSLTENAAEIRFDMTCLHGTFPLTNRQERGSWWLTAK